MYLIFYLAFVTPILGILSEQNSCEKRRNSNEDLKANLIMIVENVNYNIDQLILIALN